LSRAQGGLLVFGSVSPRIWSVSRREGKEIWKVGGVGRSSSSSDSELEWCCEGCGGAR
jgi:hypothetical protein